uniref:ZYRO0G14608p n=1 Tax=Solanum tuberosum TaxID=4113 RepID=M1B5I6_SOLTU
MLKKKKKKKRKSIKEVSLDKPEPSGKKSRSSKDEDHVNGDSVGPAESQLSSSKLEKGLDYSNRLSGFSLKFDINGNLSRVQTSVIGNDKIEGELDKTEGDQLLKKCALSGGEAKSDERSSKLPSHSASNGVTVKVKRKRSADDSREKKKDKVSSSQDAKEDGHVVVNNGETSSGKHLSTRNKRKDSSSRSRKSVKNDVPSGDNLGSFCQGSLNDDDEKKLVPGCLPKGTSTEFCSARFTSSTLSSAMKLGRVPPFALSFAVAPTFFICLHLSRVKCSEIAGSEDIAETSFTRAISAGGSSFAEWQLGSLACKQQLESTRVPLKSSQNCQLDVSRSPFTAKHSELDTSDVTVVSNNLESDDQVLDQFVGSPRRRHSKNLSHRLSNARCHSGLVGMSVVIPSSDQVEGLSDGKEIIVGEACHLSLNTGDDLISSPNHTVTSDVVRSCNITGTGDRLVQSPNPSGPGGLPHRKRNNSSSSPFGEISPVWIDGKANFTGVGLAIAQRNLERRCSTHCHMEVMTSVQCTKIKAHELFLIKELEELVRRRMQIVVVVRREILSY